MTVAEMTALVWTAPYEAVLEQRAVPVAGEGEAVVRVRATGVCGSDLHGFRGHSPLRVAPLVLGHEAVVEDEHGALFVVNPLVGCGRCRLCDAGQPNLCPQRGLLGLDRPGTFAEHVSVPRANLLPLPAHVPIVLGALTEALATPVAALAAAAPGPDAVVAVIGCGPIGLLACHAARRWGASLVAAYDLDERRVAHARRIADVAGTSAEELRGALDGASAGLGADVVIDAVGIEASWTAALELVRPGGTVAEVGLGAAVGAAPVGHIVRQGIRWQGVYAYTPTDFAAALELIAGVPPELGWVETARLDDGPELLAELARGAGPVKAVFEL